MGERVVGAIYAPEKASMICDCERRGLMGGEMESRMCDVDYGQGKWRL
jgi:hypothetical protein